MADEQRTSDCHVGRHEIPFTFPDDLLADLLEGKATIFAGAGISTESRSVLKRTFYDDVADELGNPSPPLTFAPLMENTVSSQTVGSSYSKISRIGSTTFIHSGS
jgi:hypothetical protein